MGKLGSEQFLQEQGWLFVVSQLFNLLQASQSDCCHLHPPQFCIRNIYSGGPHCLASELLLLWRIGCSSNFLFGGFRCSQRKTGQSMSEYIIPFPRLSMESVDRGWDHHSSNHFLDTYGKMVCVFSPDMSQSFFGLL